MKIHTTCRTVATLALACSCAAGHALEWSDNAIGLRVGSRFAEPGIPGSSISKTIFNFTHASGDTLGRNLVVADLLQSGSSDPAAGGGGGAQEFYGFYRRTFSVSRMSGKPMAYGPFKDLNLVLRGDLQTKNISFAPRARKLIAGGSVEFAVPRGFIESGLYAYKESNHNGVVGKDVQFSTTYMLDTAWMIPFNVGLPARWKGSVAYTGAKGKDGFGGNTRPELMLDTAVMFDIGDKTGLSLGLGYELWRNKYGNDQRVTPGARHNTPLLLAEYHF